jgi:hypothetical protein
VQSFFLAGAALVIRSFGASTATGELPADAPRWLRILQYVSRRDLWLLRRNRKLDRGPGERHFSGPVMTGNAMIDAAVSRTAFGVGAVIIWFCIAAVIALGIHKLFDQKTPRAS